MGLKKVGRMGFSSFAEFNVYLTFILLGMSIMLVVSAITSAPNFVTEFYKYATGDPDAVCEKPYFWDNANTFYNVGTYGAQLICEPMAILPIIRRIPLQVRLYTGLTIMVIEMLLLIAIPSATISSQDGAIALIMVISVFGGLSKGLVDATTIAMVSPFPTKFFNGELWGLSVISLIMSVIQCILQASMASDFHSVLNQSRIYIGIGMAIQLFAIFQLAIMPLNPFAQKYNADYRVRALARRGTLTEQEDELQGRPDDVAPRRLSSGSNEPATADSDGSHPNRNANSEHRESGPAEGELRFDDDEAADMHHKHDPLEPSRDDAVAAVNLGSPVVEETAGFLDAKGDADKMRDADQTGNLNSSDQLLRTDAIKVLRHVWPMLLAAFCIFFTTMLLFPGVFFKVPTTDPWYMTIIVLLFNVGDFTARILLMFRSLRPPPKAVIVGTLARLAVIPLLVVCARGFIKGEWLPYILMTLLGLTNGFFGAMAMIHCPRTPTLRTAGQRAIAGQWSGCFLMAGLAFGSFLQLAITLTWKPVN